MRLTREAILAARDTQGVVVPVPEWGGDVYVRGLTGGDVLDMAKAFGTGSGDIPLLVYSIVDEETNERLFTMADIDALRAKGMGPIMRILAAIKEVSGLGDEAPKATAASS